MMQTLAFDPLDTWDNLHGPSPADVHWSTDNVGEAVPGVVSPLGASIWSEVGERTTRESFVAIGAFPRREAAAPDRLEDRVVRVFCGRLAMKVELLTSLGDRLPGTSGQEIATSLFGTVPDDIAYCPTRRRYPVLAVKLPATFVALGRQLRTEPPLVHRWWQDSVKQVAGDDLAGARRRMREAVVQFERALKLQSTAVIGSSQLVHEALSQLIERAGVGDLGALSGSGGAEMAVIGDIWKASRGQLTLEQVVHNHGFHGPLEGEISSVVWREDPAPLKRIVAEYAQLGEDADPRHREAQLRAALPELQREVVAALPRSRRPAARLVLHLAATRIPLRGVAKRSFLQGLDVTRACARRIGAELVQAGRLEAVDDAFYLALDELLGGIPADADELVSRRRERRRAYQGVSIPGAWKGLVVPTAIEPDGPDDERPSIVSGVGVSGGVVEGVVRVVTDPAFTEVEPGEVLVAPTTDPSWASIMYISSALVVDIGGPLSHAAVVARELGLPCVVNTRTGTRQLRTGDRVRVDGDGGTVEILSAHA